MVTMPEEGRHGLETGDAVVFRDLQGMPGLVGCAPCGATRRRRWGGGADWCGLWVHAGRGR